MRLPLTLAWYIGRNFAASMGVALGGLMVLVLMIDTLELIRRTAEKPGVPFSAVLEMALLKGPEMAIRMLPFAVLIGSMMALTRLTRRSELVAARAAGISVWQFLSPALLLVFVFGCLFVSVMNPIAAAMLSRFERLEGQYITQRTNLLTVSESGLWLRQPQEGNPYIADYVFHAPYVAQDTMQLSRVTIFTFDADNRFVYRLDASQARLFPSRWLLQDVIQSAPGYKPVPIRTLALPTSLTIEDIQDSFASPETISFWELPKFIETLQEAGFSAKPHQLHWHVSLASPFLYASLVLVAAAFSLRLPRRGGVGTLIVAGLLTGFVLHFITDLIHALGLAGDLPLILAAWAPAGLIAMGGSWLMLHQEDG